LDGLFAHGFALCGTTHAQWIAELQSLLGHNRACCVDTTGHNSFEVYLQGGPYRDGNWVLLDHDLSTVIFNPAGDALLSIAEVQRDFRRLTDRRYLPEKQHGWQDAFQVQDTKEQADQSQLHAGLFPVRTRSPRGRLG
jgi:hypothetical protein